MHIDLHVKCLLYLSDCIQTEFSQHTLVNIYIYRYIYNFTKIRPSGTELFHAGGRADGHDANSRFFGTLRTCLNTETNTASIYSYHILQPLRENGIDLENTRGDKCTSPTTAPYGTCRVPCVAGARGTSAEHISFHFAFFTPRLGTFGTSFCVALGYNT
jgi:hypothetical protein